MSKRSGVEVPKAFHNKRLDKALELLMPGTDLKTRRRVWEQGWVLVNGYAREKNYRVKTGQRLDVMPFDLDEEARQRLGLRVVKEHGDFAALYKPPGMPVSARKGEGSAESLLPEFWPDMRPRILNLLDREASGLLLVALSKPAANSYLTIDSKFVSCVYHALADGMVDRQFTIKNRLENLADGRVRPLDQDIPTFLRWTIVTPIKYLPRLGATVVAAQLHKGARLQVRAHMAAMGNPVVGDPLYGQRREGRLYLHLHGIELPGFAAECDPEWPDIPFILPE